MSTRISPHAKPRFSRSLEYGAAILECFTSERPVLRNSEIASIVKISRSTTNRYLSTLAELGYVEQNSERRYLLARGAAQAGIVLVNTVRQESPARTILEELRDQTGHTVSMGLLDGAQVLYVYRLHGHRLGQYEADGDLGIGAHVSAHCTAIGKALLSSLLDSELRSLLSDEQSSDAQLDAATQALLVEDVDKVRKNDIALSETPRSRSIATPIARWLNKPILAVELTVPTGAYTNQELIASFSEPVRRAASLLSR